MKLLLSPLIYIFCLTACATPSAPTPPPPPSETLRTLTGVVTETDPTPSVRIAGALIEVTGGAHAGLSTISDANGSYLLAGVSGPVELTITHPDYAGRVVTATRKDAAPVDVQLMPVFRQISEVRRFTGQGSHSTSFAVHNPGEISVSEMVLSGFESGDGYDVQLWDESALLARSRVSREFPTSRAALTVTVSGGHVYTVRFLRSGTLPKLTSARFSYPN